MKLMSLKKTLMLVPIAAGIMVGVVLICYILRSTGDSRERAECEHGIRLPPSAVRIQCRGDGWLRKTPISGGGVTTLFEMDPAEVSAFLAPFHIRSRTAPVITMGDPTVNGWNVWPQGSATFVPGNSEYGGFQRSWTGTAAPVEMVSCDSPVGMWLHLEFWKLESGMMLAKICTMWDD